MNTLVLALVDLAVQITKWIVRNAARWAKKRLLAWMWRRIRTFKQRWERARIEGDERRQRWLTSRIQRWTKAAEWIEEKADEVLKGAAERACKLPAFQKLPDYASCERLTSH